MTKISFTSCNKIIFIGLNQLKIRFNAKFKFWSPKQMSRTSCSNFTNRVSPSQTEGQRALSAIYENRGNFGDHFFMHENFGKGRVIFRAGYIPTENGSKRKILAGPVFN